MGRFVHDESAPIALLMPQEAPRKRVYSARSNVFLAIIASIALCIIAAKRLVPTLSLGPSSCRHAQHGRIQYKGEHISWQPCGEVDDRPLECSNITVPMDHFDLENSGNKTFDIALIRLRGGEHAKESVLLNPGGPGGSGFEFVHRRGKQLSDIVGDGFHLLSFDPRGINRSTPMASCFPTTEDRKKHPGFRDTTDFEHDSPEAFAWAQNYVQACADTMGVHGAYINTPQTAADMNSILDAIGQEDMVYWGFSYGTILGQTYASLFPDRSKRVIIDGVANNFHWYGHEFDTEQFTNTDDVFQGFFEECFKAGKNCSLSAFADSPSELRNLVLDLGQELKEQPLSVYINSTTYGLLDYQKLFFDGIFVLLYRPAGWYALSENLAKLLKGNATDAWLAYGQGSLFGLENDANDFVTKNDAESGPKYWPQSREELLDEIIDTYRNKSRFALTEGAGHYVRQQWPVPRTHNFSQEQSVQTAHPLLILSTTYDPICPLKSAKVANKAFEGSRLVEVEGYGHCSVAVPSTCLAKKVREFLYNGTLPDGYTKCETDGPYFVVPEEDGKVVATKVFENPEDEKIHLAQRELAKDWDIGRPVRW